MTISRRALLTLIAAGTAGPALAQNDLLQQGLKILGGGARSGTGSGLSDIEIGSGLREALRIGTGNVVGFLGRHDGFNLDPVAHIPLPRSVRQVRDGLRLIGQSGLLDDLELKMNRAAETATPRAKAIFWQAIDQMTSGDAQQILTGPDDSATQYFRRTMSPPLAHEMRPIVNDAMAETGAVQAYDRTVGAVQSIPFAPNIRTNLTDYVVDAGMNGIFHYVAVEERNIRRNPAARTTDLLRRVFG